MFFSTLFYFKSQYEILFRYKTLAVGSANHYHNSRLIGRGHRPMQTFFSNARRPPEGAHITSAQLDGLLSVPISLETLSPNSLISRAKEIFNVSKLIIIKARESITR